MTEDEDKLVQQIAMLEKVAKQYITKQAIQRYGNLKLGHQDVAIKAIAMIAQACQLGQIKEPLSDEDFKSLLIEIQRDKKSFNFKK